MVDKSYRPSNSPYPRSTPRRKVSGKEANQMAGDKRYPEGKDGRPIKASTVLSRGRRDPGMKNPRGGQFLEADVHEQLRARPGGMSQPAGDRSQYDRNKADLINSILRNENRKGYDKQQLLAELAAKDQKKGKKKKRGLKDIGNQDDGNDAENDDDADDGDHEYR